MDSADNLLNQGWISVGFWARVGVQKSAGALKSVILEYKHKTLHSVRASHAKQLSIKSPDKIAMTS